MSLKPIVLSIGAVCIALLNTGCSQKAADTSPSPQVTQAATTTPLTPEQQAQKDAWAKNQEALMKAQYQAHSSTK